MVQPKSRSRKSGTADVDDNKRTKKQQRLFSTEVDGPSMFEKKCPGKVYKDEIILLDETIYGTNIPNDAKCKSFKYQVMDYDDSLKRFRLQFMGQAIGKEGTNWIDFPCHKGDKKMNDVKEEKFKDGCFNHKYIYRSSIIMITGESKRSSVMPRIY